MQGRLRHDAGEGVGVMVEIADRKSAEAWLRTQPREVQVAFAARCALRALPALGFLDREAFGGIALITCRAMLTSGVAALVSTPEVRSAASSASAAKRAAAADAAAFAAASSASAAKRAASASAAFAAASSAAFAAFAAADAASASAAKRAASSAAFAAASYDATQVENGVALRDLFAEPLWPAGLPEGVAQAEDTLRARFADAPRIWGFWAEWYDSMVSGRPMDWSLQEAVALIPDEIWEAGPEQVAREIRRRRLVHRTAVAAKAVFDDEQKKFTLESDPALPEETVAFVRQRIEMALRNALAEGLSNGFAEDSPEAQIIRDVIAEYPDNGSMLAVFFFDACMSLQANIGDRYPREVSLVNLKNALFGAVEEICEIDEVAKQRCARLAALNNPEPITLADAKEAQKVPEALADLTDEEMARIMERDAETIASTTTGKPPKAVLARFTNWVTTITIWLDNRKKDDARVKWLFELVERLQAWWGDGG